MSLEDNITKAEGYLARFRQQPVMHRIGGVDVGNSETFSTASPIDESELASIANGNQELVDRAVGAAKAAFPLWAGTSGEERRKILLRLADAIQARAEEIALVEAVDTGQPVRFMSKAALRGAENFRFFANQAPAARDGKSLFAPGQLNITSRSPLGPAAIITPWNTPFMLSTWKIAPALACGCTVVHKPAELSPLTARLLVEIAEEAGVPAGVWNLVNGFGEDTGKALTEHPDIKAVAFVGESRTGSMIQRQGADTLKRVHFELGGKNPVIVFRDSDIERACEAATFMIYSLNGERCTSSSRLLVEAEIYDEVVERIAHKAKNIKVGHPLDPKTVVGPLIDGNHLSKVVSYFATAREEGARIVTGGERLTSPSKGYYVPPTLLADAKNHMRIAQEEIFGPVLTAIAFHDETQAVQMANDTPYGLAAYLWSNNVHQALRVADALEAGMIWVNSENTRHLPAPFGGAKASGLGRDGGDWSFDFYMETKNVCFADEDHKVPKLASP